MRALMRRFSFLIYFLLFQMLWTSHPALLANAMGATKDASLSAETQEDESSQGLEDNFKKDKKLNRKDQGSSRVASLGVKQGQLKVVVLEVNDGNSKPKDIERVGDTLRDELQLLPRFQTLSKQETEAFFINHPDVLASSEGGELLNRYLEEGLSFFKDLQFKDAIGILSNTIDSFRRAKKPLAENFQLVDAYLSLGNVYMASKQKKQALDSFKEAVRLDPDREITTRYYSPNTVREFTEAKKEKLGKTKSTKLEIFSSPSKADVYINGVNRGQTPLKIDFFPTGEHYVLLKKPGYEPSARKIELKESAFREKIPLNKIESRNSAPRGFEVKSVGDVEEQVKVASRIGNAMKVDKVMLVSVIPVGYNHKITARMIDMAYQASHKQKSIDVLNLPKDTRAASKVLAKDLEEKSYADLAKDPKKYADTDVLVIGKRKKKSKALLYGLLGVLAAGGATAGLLLRGGGSNESSVGIGGNPFPTAGSTSLP
ncbi:MAG: PEGA domain-containing protein [Deltaproteobacteria bacterium]|nr:PEGA domain-containing protein [Deltaproteobacteria bacterium]